MDKQVKDHKYLYVVRWVKQVDDELESGNFEFGFEDECEAIRAMLDDYNNTKSDWEGNNEHQIDGKATGDYCRIDDNRTGDYHEWYVDKISY